LPRRWPGGRNSRGRIPLFRVVCAGHQARRRPVRPDRMFDASPSTGLQVAAARAGAPRISRLSALDGSPISGSRRRTGEGPDCVAARGPRHVPGAIKQPDRSGRHGHCGSRRDQSKSRLSTGCASRRARPSSDSPRRFSLKSRASRWSSACHQGLAVSGVRDMPID